MSSTSMNTSVSSGSIGRCSTKPLIALRFQRLQCLRMSRRARLRRCSDPSPLCNRHHHLSRNYPKPAPPDSSSLPCETRPAHGRSTRSGPRPKHQNRPRSRNLHGTLYGSLLKGHRRLRPFRPKTGDPITLVTRSPRVSSSQASRYGRRQGPWRHRRSQPVPLLETPFLAQPRPRF